MLGIDQIDLLSICVLHYEFVAQMFHIFELEKLNINGICLNINNSKISTIPTTKHFYNVKGGS